MQHQTAIIYNNIIAWETIILIVHYKDSWRHMKIVIIGLGSIGRTILKNLSGEGHTITIIDENKDLIEGLIEKYDVFRSEEFKSYFAIIAGAIAMVFISLVWRFEAFPQVYTTEEAFRHSLFQVASLMTTAGYTTTDYHVWPILATTSLILVMYIGAMAGSTAGGIKVSRIVIAIKGAYINIRKMINPRYVPKAKFEGKILESKTINDVFGFITLYFFIFLAVLFLLAFDPVNGQIVNIVSNAGTYTVEHGFFSNFSAVLTCSSNVGPAFEAVGPYSNFAGYNNFSTIVLTFTMMLGRLEILPVLILFSKRTWKRV